MWNSLVENIYDVLEILCLILIVPLSFSCVFTGPFCYLFRLATSKRWSVWYDQCVPYSWAHSHASFDVKCVPWLDAMLHGSGIVVLAESLRAEKKARADNRCLFLLRKSCWPFQDGRSPIKSTQLPSDQLVSLKTSAILRAYPWSLLLAEKAFRGSSGLSLCCRNPCITLSLLSWLLHCYTKPGQHQPVSSFFQKCLLSLL